MSLFLFVAFYFIAYVWVKACIFFPFPSDLFHLAWYSQDPSMLLQIARFHPFWLLFYCIYGPHLLYPVIPWRTLRFFHVLHMVNNAIITIGVHRFLWLNVFKYFGQYPERGLLGHMVVLFLIFWETFILFSIVVVPIYISNSREWGFPFFCILSSSCYFLSLC